VPRFAANLSFLFQEAPFLERFALAAACGFRGVECLFPYDHPVEELHRRLKASGLRQVLLNAPPGDWDGGERGLAALPGREADCEEAVSAALRYAEALDCPRIHLMAGVAPAGADGQACRATYVANLRRACARAAEAGREITIEPINGRDMPGYLLQRQAEARRVIDAVGMPNLRLQFDLYHCQIMEGDLARTLEGQIDLVGHVQIAGVPDRHEPDEGEVNYTYLFALLDRLGYDGWVGCEYRPRGDTRAGLSWGSPFGLLPAFAD